MKKLFTIFFAIVISAPGFCYEVLPICAKSIHKDGSPSKSYAINEARIIKGSELNERTKSFDYDSFETYVLIWWAQDQVSIIKMDMSYFSGYNNSGVDQTGRKWMIDKRMSKESYCF